MFVLPTALGVCSTFNALPLAEALLSNRALESFLGVYDSGGASPWKASYQLSWVRILLDLHNMESPTPESTDSYFNLRITNGLDVFNTGTLQICFQSPISYYLYFVQLWAPYLCSLGPKCSSLPSPSRCQCRNP